MAFTTTTLVALTILSISSAFAQYPLANPAALASGINPALLGSSFNPALSSFNTFNPLLGGYGSSPFATPFGSFGINPFQTGYGLNAGLYGLNGLNGLYGMYGLNNLAYPQSLGLNAGFGGFPGSSLYGNPFLNSFNPYNQFPQILY